MDPDIVFKFEGKWFSVPSTAYDLKRIVLPDGRVLEAESWLPRPVGLHLVPVTFSKSVLDRIASEANGAVAALEGQEVPAH